jgi:sugar O-acyltransferase (sialic acid O-acetyltransferase NeuD family)
MTKTMRFKLGKINPNEDEATVVEVAVPENGIFPSGALLLVLETTKATVEIVSPVAGRMVAIAAKPGATLRHGDVVFEAEFDAEVSFETLDVVEEVKVESVQSGLTANVKKVSYKAEKLAKQIGVDIKKVESDGDVIKEIDVQRYADKFLLGHLKSTNADSRASCEASRVKFDSKAIIFGAGGHARAILQMVREAGYHIVGVVDSSLQKNSVFADQIPVLGAEGELPSIYSSGVRFAFIGVGGATNNDARIRIYDEVKKSGFVLPPLVSKTAHLETTSSIGEATYIFPASSVGANCTVGSNVIVNQGVIICHDCEIGNHVHLAPGAILAGSVKVGCRTTIGMGSTVMNGLSIGEDCLVHNLVAVNQDIIRNKIVAADGFRDRK